MKKKITVLSVAGVGIIAAGVMSIVGMVSVSNVAAQVSNGDYPLIIQNLAEKFGLNPDDVEQVFDDTRDQREEARLDDAVSEGLITEDQKQLILDKRDEFQSQAEEIRDQSLTSDERHDAMQQLHEEIETWADENDIPLYLVIGFGMKGPRFGMHGGWGMGMHLFGNE